MGPGSGGGPERLAAGPLLGPFFFVGILGGGGGPWAGGGGWARSAEPAAGTEARLPGGGRGARGNAGWRGREERGAGRAAPGVGAAGPVQPGRGKGGQRPERPASGRRGEQGGGGGAWVRAAPALAPLPGTGPRQLLSGAASRHPSPAGASRSRLLAPSASPSPRPAATKEAPLRGRTPGSAVKSDERSEERREDPCGRRVGGGGLGLRGRAVAEG